MSVHFCYASRQTFAKRGRLAVRDVSDINAISAKLRIHREKGELYEVILCITELIKREVMADITNEEFTELRRRLLKVRIVPISHWKQGFELAHLHRCLRMFGESTKITDSDCALIQQAATEYVSEHDFQNAAQHAESCTFLGLEISFRFEGEDQAVFAALCQRLLATMH